MSETCSCLECHKTLVTAGITPGQRVRCGHCSHTFQFGKDQTSTADRLAWRSLYFGIASFLLCAFTGIPAFIYGVRSLMRMRFNTPRKSDQIAAVTGTILGSFFGVFGSLALVISSVAGLLLWNQFSRADSPEEISKLYAEYFRSEIPRDLKPLEGSQAIKGQAVFMFSDSSDADSQTVFLYLQYSRAAAQPLRPQIEGNLRRAKLSQMTFSEPQQVSRLDWQIFDTDVPVTKSVFVEQTEEGEVEFVQYFGLLKERLRTLGISITVKQPHLVYDEEQVKELFNSFEVLN